MPYWHRLAVFGVVLLVTLAVARIVDRRLARRDLPAATMTRYRILRRSILTVIGIVVGFAAQRTIGNFIAGLLIAFSQPIRLGDYVETGGVTGIVEEIGLTYTFIRIEDNDRLVVPNEKIASDTIRNSSIRSGKKLAHVTLQVPLDTDLEAAGTLLREAAGDERAEVAVTDLADRVSLSLSVWASDERSAERLEHELRLRSHTRLREAGIFA